MAAVEYDLKKLANHIANLTEHIGHLSGLIHAMGKELSGQRESFNELRAILLRHCEDDDEDLHFKG